MATLTEDVLVEFHAGLSKLSDFLQNILPKELLSSEADFQRKECITVVEGMNESLNNMKNNNLKGDKLLNAGLSVSSHSINDTNYINSTGEERIPRSGSLPDISNSQSENSEDWQTNRTTKASYFSNKRGYLDEEININELRELVIYHPFEEEEDTDSNDDNTHDNLVLNGSNEQNTSNRSPVNKRKSRKRDSAALFDISLEDLTEPDFAGFLKEKHSEKLWWCVLIDQHLCIFPSQEPDEVAYDVIIMSCCQISLDDRLMRTPVFRLTQSGMVPWVFVAANNNELKEWMKVLTIAASDGKNSSTQATNLEEKQFSVSNKVPVMQSIVEEEEEEEEIIDEEKELPSSSLKPEINPASAQISSSLNESEENVPVGYVEPVEDGYESKKLPEIPYLGELPKIPDEADGEQFGEDVYEAVANLKSKANNNEGEEYQDDGFATDEFDSGSESGGDVSPNMQAQPVQHKAKKKKQQIFHWLKKKARKDKLFSSRKDGVALAGYAYKANDASKRWFLIREEKLHCYKTIKDDDPETTVDLKGTEIKAGEEEKSKLAINVIRDGVCQFILVAKSAKDWDRWKKAFLIESGFIKLATSPTESSSGVFEQEDEDDYAMPVISPEMEKKLSAEKPEIKIQLADTPKKAEDPYTEVDPNAPVTDLKSISPSVSQQELGPLPPIPPDLPPDRSSPDGEEGKEDSDNGDYLGDGEEIYEEVSSAVPHADKVIKWDGVNSPSSPTSPTGGHSKSADKASKGPMPAGVSDGTIEDSAITASSFMDNSSRPFAGRLNSSAGAWCPNVNDKQQYLQIDLGEVTKVCGVASQGRPGFIDQGGWFVKTYTIAYSKDGENWANYKEFGIAKVFQGNHDPDTVVTNMLKMAVNAHYVRIKPQSWYNHIALRVEVYKGEASSKLTAGIHKLADTFSKKGKKKSFDKQNTLTSPTNETHNEVDEKYALESKVPSEDKVSYVDRQSSTENLLEEGEEEDNYEEPVAGVQNKAVAHDEGQQADGYLEFVREPTTEEKEAELKVQQKIEALKKGEEGSQPIGKQEVSQGILAKKSVYENNQQNEVKAESKKNGATKTKKENGLTNKEVVVERRNSDGEKTESKANKPRTRQDSESYDPDREREELEKTEKAFKEYAKQMKREGSQQRPSLVALNRMNFEDPRTVSKTKESASYLEKSASLQKEKEELLKKQETLKKRISVAKDRKIFFSLSTTRSKATADAEAEFHESQCELAKIKKRLLEIENETKNLKLMELKHQKTPEKSSSVNPAKPLVRKNSKECKLGSADTQVPKADTSATSAPEDELAQKGTVLSQIKAFEQPEENELKSYD